MRDSCPEPGINEGQNLRDLEKKSITMLERGETFY
jgi:hypothetical protein